MIQFLKTLARVFNRNLHKFLNQKIQSKNCEILLTTGISSYHLNAIIARIINCILRGENWYLHNKKSLHHSIEG